MRLFLPLVFIFLHIFAFAQQPADLTAQNAAPVTAQVAAQAQLTAAELYNAGKYLAAAFEYETQAKAQPKNPYVYYNLANSYFKAGDPDRAIINYYRAFRLLPRDKDIKANLDFVLNTTAQKLKREDIPQVIFDVFYLLSFAELKGLIIIFAWAAALFFAFFMAGFGKPFNKTALKYTFGFIVFFGLWYMARMPYDTKALAVVTAARAEVRSGPGDNFPVSLSIPRAHLVILSDTKGEWAQVQIEGDNSEGWVLKNAIEEI